MPDITITAEIVDVPQTVIDVVIATYARLAQQGHDFDPEITEALRGIVDRALPAGATAGTVRIGAAAAWWLADPGDALDAHGLDEDDPAVWEHPAVLAQQHLADLVDEQAPATAARLGAALEASYADTHAQHATV